MILVALVFLFLIIFSSVYLIHSRDYHLTSHYPLFSRMTQIDAYPNSLIELKDQKGERKYVKVDLLKSDAYNKTLEAHGDDFDLELTELVSLDPGAKIPIQIEDPDAAESGKMMSDQGEEQVPWKKGDDPFKTKIFHLDPAGLGFEKAKLSLKKSDKKDRVNAILTCSTSNYEVGAATCKSWQVADVEFRDEGDKITFETTHFSAYVGVWLDIINIQSNLTQGDDWTVNFRTYGQSNLTIKAVDGTHFHTDLEFKGLYCGENKISDDQLEWNGDTLVVRNYECGGQISKIVDRAITPGRHWLSFSFGDTEGALAHNFACNSGTLDDTCTVSSSNTMSNGELISGTGNLVIASGGALTTTGTNAFSTSMGQNITIQSGGTITGNITSAVAANFYINSGGSINVNGKGYSTSGGSGGGGTCSGASGNYGGGAGHGGVGAAGSGSGSGGGTIYDAMPQPDELGSGGGNNPYYGGTGGTGGGVVKLVVAGTVQVDGPISADAAAGSGSHSGGGSGGSIWIDAGTLAGGGAISANGGTGGSQPGGGGGGGRIAIYYSTNNYSSVPTVSAGSGYAGGSVGTLMYYNKTAGQFKCSKGTPTLNNTDITGTGATALALDAGCNMIVNGNLTLTGTLSVGTSSAATLTINNALDVGSINVDNSSSLYLKNATDVNNDVTISGSSSMIGVGNTGTGQGITINAGNITINSGSSLTANSQGYAASGGPGGGGTPAQSSTNYGGGGGHGGAGGNGSGAGSGGGSTYDSMTQPDELGSGGGSATYYGAIGGSGGGALKIVVAGTIQVDGSLSANGGVGNGSHSAGGSGGSIWIDANTLSGGGIISANGGNGDSGQPGGGGGGGRIAIYYSTKTYSGTPTVSAGTGYSGGAVGTVQTQQTGGAFVCQAGTPTLSNSDITGTGADDLVVDTGCNMTVNGDLNLSGTISIGSSSGATLTLNDKLSAGNLNIQNGATLNLNKNIEVVGNIGIGGSSTINAIGNTTTGTGIVISAGNISIGSGSKITADALGYAASNGPGGGGTPAQASGNYGGGGGYGGAGGNGSGAGSGGGSAYGSSTRPDKLGSGGGSATYYGATGGSGGGAINLVVIGIIQVDGSLTANGGAGTGSHSAGGSGGSIWIDTGGLSGGGTISANGGNGSSQPGGGGGGGRIAIYYSTKTYSGTPTVTAGTGYNNGSVGTTYQKQVNREAVLKGSFNPVGSVTFK